MVIFHSLRKALIQTLYMQSKLLIPTFERLRDTSVTKTKDSNHLNIPVALNFEIDCIRV